MGSYVLIDRPNVGKERSYPILNYQFKELAKNAISKDKIRRRSNQ